MKNLLTVGQFLDKLSKFDRNQPLRFFIGEGVFDEWFGVNSVEQATAYIMGDDEYLIDVLDDIDPDVPPIDVKPFVFVDLNGACMPDFEGEYFNDQKKSVGEFDESS